MLLSMTGYGEAHRRADGVAVGVEVRTINSRYFKLSVRGPEGFASLEPEIDGVVRQQIKRGTVQVTLRIDREPNPDDFRINATALESYRRQLEELHRQWNVEGQVSPEQLLLLPGVVIEAEETFADADRQWPSIREVLEAAMQKLGQMRQAEGQAMADSLLANAAGIGEELDGIQQRAPKVVESYQTRLEERVRKTLAEYELSLDPSDLLREVSVFSDRCDISEEIVRLRSHLEQFREHTTSPQASGRKLEFLIQEMFRETNTIGSKANDVEIAQRVIEIKAAIERIREMIQNVE